MVTRQSDRLLFIDNIKALGICLVILYHCQYVPFESIAIKGMYAMCVPLFFVVNGFLMLRKEYSISMLIKKNIKLLLVMFFWAFVSTAITMWTTGEFNANGLIGGGKILILNSLLIGKPYCNHLWFLKAVFVLNLLNPIIYRFVHQNRNRLYYILILMALWSIAFSDIITCRLANPFVHWETAFSVLYYILGFTILNNQIPLVDKYLEGKKGKLILVAMMCILVLLQRGYNWIFTEGWLKDLNLEKGWVIDIVYDNYNALFVVIMTIAICALFQRINWRENKFWNFIGKNSLVIYVLQTPIQRLIQFLLPMQELTNIHHVFGAILPILTLLVCMAITYILHTNKYTKYLITI